MPQFYLCLIGVLNLYLSYELALEGYENEFGFFYRLDWIGDTAGRDFSE